MAEVIRAAYRIRQVAELLDVTPKTVERMIGRGELDAFHVGRHVRVSVAEVDRLVSGEPRVPAAS